ncbi:MAG: hypothetical protein PHY05_05945, partial [Methanothrix sp.]|nr:hypothetical protein [Methanothrix sp.]
IGALKKKPVLITLQLIVFRNFLDSQGLRPATIESYTRFVKYCLEFCHTSEPSKEQIEKFRESLFARHLARLSNWNIAQYEDSTG